MAYDLNKLAKLNAIKQLAERVAADFATKSSVNTLSTKVDNLISEGGEPNTIDVVKVNGTALTVTDKAVDIPIPTKVSQLTNDSKFQTDTEVAAAIAAVDHLKRIKVDSVSDINASAEGADNYIYMVPKTDGSGNNMFDEYMVLDGAVEHVGNTSVDLSNYVQKEEGKGLSANDFTNADKEKLDGIAEGATKVESSETPGGIKINGVDVAVVEIATDAEITEMLGTIFGEASNE